MREFEVLKKLNHKNIVKLFAIEEEVSIHQACRYVVAPTQKTGSSRRLQTPCPQEFCPPHFSRQRLETKSQEGKPGKVHEGEV